MDKTKAKDILGSWGRRIKCKIHNFFHLDFYKVHLLYFILVIAVSSGILYGANASTVSLAYIDALYLCTSAMCNVGLNPVNLGDLTGFQQCVVFVLMLLGDMTLVTASVVVVRRYYFSKRIKDLIQRSEAGRRIADDIEEQRQSEHGAAPTSREASNSVRAEHRISRLVAHPQRMMMFPWRWKALQTDYPSIRRHMAFLTPLRRCRANGVLDPFSRNKKNDDARQHSRRDFKRNLGHKVTPICYPSRRWTYQSQERSMPLRHEQKKELGGVEYRALEVLTWLLPGYCTCWLVIVMLVVTPYAAHSRVADIIRSAQPGNLSPVWWSVFATVSAYSNNGLNLLNKNMIRKRAPDATGSNLMLTRCQYLKRSHTTTWCSYSLVPRYSPGNRFIPSSCGFSSGCSLDAFDMIANCTTR